MCGNCQEPTLGELYLSSCPGEGGGDEGALKTRAALVTLSIFSLDPNAISVTRGLRLRDSKNVAWILNGAGGGGRLGFELRQSHTAHLYFMQQFLSCPCIYPVVQVGLPPSILLLQLSKCCVCHCYLVYNDANISEPFLEKILLNCWNELLKKQLGQTLLYCRLALNLLFLNIALDS